MNVVSHTLDTAVSLEEAPVHAAPAPSFDDFVAATGHRMARYAVLLCGDHHLAEDLTQTTYAKVFAHWRRVSKADDPVAYTRAILTKTFLSHRRLRRSGERPVDQVPDGAASGTDPTTRLDLAAALATLSRADRTILVLRYWEDLGVTDTARLLGITDTACRTRTSRALARLRTHLSDLEDLS